MRPSKNAIILLLIALLAAATCGCSAISDHLAFSSFGAKTKSISANVVAFNAAVEMVSELQYAKAMVEFEQVLPGLQDASDHRRAAEAMFWLGFCSEKLGRPTKAISHYDSMIRRYSDSPASSRARARLSQLRPTSSAAKTPS